MPSNENPFPVDHPLHLVYNNAGAAQKSALRGEPLHPEPTRTAGDRYAPTAWGQPVEQDFTCPSGQVCKVRRVDMMDLLGSSLLNNVDFMTSIVNSEHIPAAGGKPAVKSSEVDLVKTFAENQQNMGQFREVIDSVVLRVVMLPQLFAVPAEDTDRVEGRVYLDTVALTDKIEIFNWAVRGQSADDLERFREESKQSVGDVEHVKVVPHPTVHTAQPL